jgi:hypothetical protein
MKDQPELELPGAPSALKFIADRELQLRAILKESEAKLADLCLMKDAPPSHLDGADFDVMIAKARSERKDAEDSYYKAQKALREYEGIVDLSRRDASESITKADAEKLFSMFAIHMRGAKENSVSRFCQEAMEVKTSEEMYEKFVEIDHSCYESALKSAMQESHLPKWAVDAFLNYV